MWPLARANPCGRLQKAEAALSAKSTERSCFWTADNYLVFPWEADGWSHLYSVPASGGKALLLTPGDFEVEDVSLTTDHKNILYASNQQDIDRRHIWMVAASGGKPKQLTSGTGIEVAPVQAEQPRSDTSFR